MSTLNYLPEDLLIDILSRLSAKSLVSLRCVSKSWCALIKSPYFVSKHLHFNKFYNNQSLLCVQDRATDRSVSLLNDDGVLITNLADYDDQIKQIVNDFRMNIVGSCNGIICLTDECNAYLWNPSVKEFKSLPSPPSLHQFDDTERSYYEYAFGFDPKTNDYMVLRIWSYHIDINFSNSGHQVDIYTLSSNSWRNIDQYVPCLYLYSCVYKPHTNNIYYWIGDIVYRHSIISFDFRNEMFQKIELPPDLVVLYDMACSWGVTVLKESLAVVSWFDSVDELVDVWVMNKCGNSGVNNSWTKLMSFGPLMPAELSWKSSYFILQDDEDTLIFIDPALLVIGATNIVMACMHFESLVSLTNTPVEEI